jgi:uncharacterized protein
MKRHPWPDHRRSRRSAEKSVSLNEQGSRTATCRGDRSRATGITSADDQHVEIGHAPRFVASRGRPFPRPPKYSAMQVQVAAQERNWAMAAHLSALVAIAGLPFGHIIGPLVVYLVKGHESEFVGEHARASLNYQITVSIFVIVALIVGFAVTLGFIVPEFSSSDSTIAGLSIGTIWIAFALAVSVVVLGSVVFIILGTLAASQGRPYAYPFAIRFLR